MADCKHCRNGYFDGSETECVNGVLIDIDVAHEGWQRDVDYPPAPCCACGICLGSGMMAVDTGVDETAHCLVCNGTGWASGKEESQERLESWASNAPQAPDPRDTELSTLRAEVERQAREIEGLREALAGMLRCADALHMNRYGGKSLVQVTIKSMAVAADAARALAPKPQPPASPVIASGPGGRSDGHERFGT